MTDEELRAMISNLKSQVDDHKRWLDKHSEYINRHDAEVKEKWKNQDRHNEKTDIQLKDHGEALSATAQVTERLTFLYDHLVEEHAKAEERRDKIAEKMQAKESEDGNRYQGLIYDLIKVIFAAGLAATGLAVAS